MVRIFKSLVLVAISTAGALAQDRNWTYIADPTLFISAEDYPYAQVCTLPSWTPQNSGLSGIAVNWEVMFIESSAELEQAMTSGNCDISAFPGNRENFNDQLAVQAGLSDITEDLAFASNTVGVSPELNLEATKALASQVEGSCSGNHMRRQVVDCVCLGELALQGFADGTFAVSDSSSAALIASNALLKSGVPQNCINDAGIAQQIASQVEMRVSSPMSANDIVLTKPEEYQACSTVGAIARFRADPQLTRIARGDYIIDALLACNNL